MDNIRYKVIKSKKQYYEYCKILEKLLFKDEVKYKDDIELLYLLIEKWDNDNSILKEKDPIEVLRYLMEENNLKRKDLEKILGNNRGTISKILNYHLGLSKENIRKLADHFKVSQELFNRPYQLKNKANWKLKYSKVMNTKKDMSDLAPAAG